MPQRVSLPRGSLGLSRVCSRPAKCYFRDLVMMPKPHHTYFHFIIIYTKGTFVSNANFLTFSWSKNPTNYILIAAVR